MSEETPTKEKGSKTTPMTVKRRTLSADMSRSELLRLMSIMEAELQARDVSIAVLKAEKAHHYIKQAAYGCSVIGSGPYDALHRDAEIGNETLSVDDSNVVNVKQILDGLVETQHKSQLRTRIQLASIEKQFHKVCAELDAERKKYSTEQTEANSIRSVLEADKEKLQTELDELKDENSRLLLEIHELKEQLLVEKAESSRHQQAASVLARERTWLVSKMVALDKLFNNLETSLIAEQTRADALETELKQSRDEKLSRNFSSERVQHQQAIDERDSRLSELAMEVSRLRQQLLQLQRQQPFTSAVEPSTEAVRAAAMSPSVEYLSLESTVKSEVNRSHGDVQPGSVSVSSSVSLPYTTASASSQNAPSSATAGFSSNNLNLPYSLKAPLGQNRSFDVSGISANPSSLNSNQLSSKLSGGSPAIGQKQGLLEVSVNSDFGSVRQTKSADLSSVNLTASTSQNGQLLSGSCPGQLSSGSEGLPHAVRKLDYGIMELNIATTHQHSSPTSPAKLSSPSSPAGQAALDIFGPEMADLQELLVSMASDRTPLASQSLMSSVPSAGTATPQFTQSSLSTHVLSASSALHAAVLAGDGASLRQLLTNSSMDLNEPINGGVSLLHCAVECSSEDCVLVLLENGANPNVMRDDGRTPVHVAASDGHLRCLQLLLQFKGSPVAADRNGWTPLHCAASAGHADCCRELLDRGARIDSVTYSQWTPLHVCVQSGHSDCLVALLSPRRSAAQFGSEDQKQDLPPPPPVEDVIGLTDKDGWTVAHSAAVRETTECLEVLMRCVRINIEQRDKWNRSIFDVASPTCRQYLLGIDGRKDIICTVTVELPMQAQSPTHNTPRRPGATASSNDPPLSITIGSVVISKGTAWQDLEEKLSTLFLNHASEVSIGLRTKKTSRFDQDWPDPPSPFTLGISLNSVKYFSIGRYHWSPGTSTDKSPYDTLCGFNTNAISVKLFGYDSGSQDSLAYETLIPLSILQNYLRLIEQYKSVVFYGPKGMGKTFLVRKLAQCIQAREVQAGNASDVTFFTLSAVFSRKDLLKLLLDKGCLVTASSAPPNNTAPVLILDDLSKISVVDVFKDILPAMETRGPANSIVIRKDGSQEALTCYMHPNCYIIGTMDRSRSTGLELSVQQRFKWVQLRCDQEPMRCLLHRHLLRRLAHAHHGVMPMPDNSVYKAVEWIICIWQRLNDGLAKLGLLDMVFGPCFFLGCPIEANKPKSILKWLCQLWNTSISPAIAEAVIKGSGADGGVTGGGQTKVASTALYVLMQRAIVPGCPLSGQEKERYFATFNGTNELDIKIRGEKNRPVTTTAAGQTAPPAAHSDATATMRLNKFAPSTRPSATTALDGEFDGRHNTAAGMRTNGSANVYDDHHPSVDPTVVQSAGNTMFAVAGIPAKTPLKPGGSILVEMTNGSIQSSIGGNSFTPNSSFSRVATEIGASKVTDGLLITKSTPLVSPMSVTDAKSGGVGLDAARMMYQDVPIPDVNSVRPAYRIHESVASSDGGYLPPSYLTGSPMMRHSPVIVTQPARTGSPVAAVPALQRAADRSRSMTPPSSAITRIDRGHFELTDSLLMTYQSRAGNSTESDLAVSGGQNSFRSADLRFADLSPVHRGNSDMSPYSSSVASMRPSSAGTGVASNLSVENGSRFGHVKAASSINVPFANKPMT